MQHNQYTTDLIAVVTLEGSMFHNRTCTVGAILDIDEPNCRGEYAEVTFTDADLPAWAHNVRIRTRHLCYTRASQAAAIAFFAGLAGGQ